MGQTEQHNQHIHIHKQACIPWNTSWMAFPIGSSCLFHDFFFFCFSAGNHLDLQTIHLIPQPPCSPLFTHHLTPFFFNFLPPLGVDVLFYWYRSTWPRLPSRLNATMVCTGLLNINKWACHDAMIQSLERVWSLLLWESTSYCRLPWHELTDPPPFFFLFLLLPMSLIPHHVEMVSHMKDITKVWQRGRPYYTIPILTRESWYIRVATATTENYAKNNRAVFPHRTILFPALSHSTRPRRPTNTICFLLFHDRPHYHHEPYQNIASCPIDIGGAQLALGSVQEPHRSTSGCLADRLLNRREGNLQ